MSVFVKGFGCKMDGTGEGGGGGEGVARGDDCIYKLQFITLSSGHRPFCLWRAKLCRLSVWLTVCVWHACSSRSRHDLLMRWYWLSPVLKAQFLSFSLAAQSAECRLAIFSLPESRRCNAEVSNPFISCHFALCISSTLTYKFPFGFV